MFEDKMRLENKKELAARALKVGKERITFNSQRLAEIKEAITKQDMKDLRSSGAIKILDKSGRKKIVKRKTRKKAGSVRKKVKNSKEKYMTLTRKFRAHLKNLKISGKISKEDFSELRKEIRASSFRSLAHLKERIAEVKK